MRGVSERGAWNDWLEYFLLGVARMSEDALSRAMRMNARLAEWQKAVAGDSTNAPSRVVELLAANPFITVKGAAGKLGVAFTTGQRAIERLERLGVVQKTRPGVLRQGTARHPGRAGAIEAGVRTSLPESSPCANVCIVWQP